MTRSLSVLRSELAYQSTAKRDTGVCGVIILDRSHALLLRGTGKAPGEQDPFQSGVLPWYSVRYHQR